MLTVIAAILVFCVLIFTHELGHFVVAKICGVYVSDFSLGMGPRLLRIKGKETEYNLRLLPIGGWCKMEGEDEDSPHPRAFCSKSVGRRMAIVAAGPVMNFITAILLFVVIFMMLGTYSGENVIGQAMPGSPAEAAGLHSGDRVIAVNDAAIDKWADISAAVNQAEPGAPLNVQVQRNGETLTLTLAPVFDETNQYWMIGIQPERARQNLFTAIAMGCEQSVLFTKELILSIVGMFQGTVPVDVAGPVGIVSIIGDTAASGLRYLLLLTAYLSINLGLVNLFPLPALDGSRLVFLAVEGLRGKALPREREGMIHFVGLVLLFGVMILVTYQDIMRLIAS